VINAVVTRDQGRPIYWLDLNIGPIDQPGIYYWHPAPQVEFKDLADLPLELVVTVLGEALVTTPSWSGPVEVSLSTQPGDEILIGRIGVRKLVGSFHVKKVSSTIPFLKVESQTLIDGNNYLIKITTGSREGLRAGIIEGAVRIDTDDARKPRIDVPCRIKLVP